MKPTPALVAFLVLYVTASPAATVTTVAGTGTKGFSGGGGPAARAELKNVFGVDKDGSVFIGDSETHRVRVWRK